MYLHIKSIKPKKLYAITHKMRYLIGNYMYLHIITYHWLINQ